MQVRPNTNNNIHTIAPTMSMATLVARNRLLPSRKLDLELTSKFTRLTLVNDKNFFVDAFEFTLDWQIGIQFMAERDKWKLTASRTLRTAIFTSITVRDTGC